MNFKKLSVFVLILVSLTLPMLIASPSFSLTESGDTAIYDDSFKEVAKDTKIAKSGYIILTGGERAVLKSDFAEIYIAPDSIFSFTDFSLDNPSVYLVSGQVNIYMLYPQDRAIKCYTPASSFDISAAGEYVAVSTDDQERIYNLTDSHITLFDGIRGKTHTTDTYTYHDMITEESDLPIDKEMFASLSIFGGEASRKAAEATVPVAISMDAITAKTEVQAEPKLPSVPVFTKTTSAPSVPVFTKTTSSPFVPAAPMAPRMTVNTEEIIRIPSYPDFTAVHVVQKLESQKIIPIDAPKVVPVYIDRLKAPTLNVKTEPVAASVETAAPKQDASGVEKKITVHSEEVSARKKFNLYINSLLVLDNVNGTRAGFSLMPSFDTGTFKMLLNFDLFRLSKGWGENDFKSIYNYALGTVDHITYNSLNEKFGVSLTRENRVIEYDPMDVMLSENTAYDPNAEKLSFTHFVKSPYFSHNLTVDDISLNDDDKINGAYFADISFSERWKLTLSLGSAFSFDTTEIASSIFIPEAVISIPFTTGDGFSMQAKLAMSTYCPANADYDAYNSTLALSFPISFAKGRASIETGGDYNFGALRRGQYSSSYQVPDNTFNLNFKAGYQDKNFSVNLFGIVPLDTNDVKLIEGGDYVELSAGLHLADFQLNAGMRSAGLLSNSLDAIKNSTDYYTTLSYANPSFETGISFIRVKNAFNLKIFNTIKDFTSDYTPQVEKTESRLFNFGLALSYVGQEGSFSTVSFFPFIELGSKDFNISLQAPLSLKLDDLSFSFSSYDNLVYDFGTSSASSTERNFDLIADCTAFIRGLQLGNSDTAFHLYLQRDYTFERTTNLIDFNLYSFRDNLTGILGTRFGQYGVLDVILPNLSKPNLVSGNLKLFPTGHVGQYDMDLSIPVEFLLTSDNNYNLSIYPYVNFTLHTGTKVSLNVFFTTPFNLDSTSGSVVFTQSLFGSAKRYTFGGGMCFSFMNSRIEADFGLYQGRNDYERFNPFYEVMGYKYEDLTAEFADYDNQSKYFGGLCYRYSSFDHKLRLSYRMDNVTGAMESDYASDIFNFDYAYSLNGNTDLSFGVYMTGIKHLLFNIKDFKTAFDSSKTLFYTDIEKTYGNYSLGIRLNYAPEVDDADNTYVNSFAAKETSAFSISTFATVRY
jgi:hypothetical protein